MVGVARIELATPAMSIRARHQNHNNSFENQRESAVFERSGCLIEVAPSRLQGLDVSQLCAKHPDLGIKGLSHRRSFGAAEVSGLS
jgi:hypothetical protein